MSSDPIILSIPEELRRRLEEAVSEDQRSLAQAAQEAIEAYLEGRHLRTTKEAAIVAAALAQRARAETIDEDTMDRWVAEHCAGGPKEPPDER